MLDFEFLATEFVCDAYCRNLSLLLIGTISGHSRAQGYIISQPPAPGSSPFKLSCCPDEEFPVFSFMRPSAHFIENRIVRVSMSEIPNKSKYKCRALIVL